MTQTVAPTLAQSIATAQAVRTEMKASLVERDAEVDILLLSIIAKTHPLFIGSGGVAKSMTVTEMHSRITGATKFEILMRKTLPVEAIVGPISLKGLEHDQFRHVISDRFLPEANIALLDEIFKSNAVVLNALLGILNERKFHNDGQILRVPLWSCVGASNELPTETELAAFRDRFGACKIVEPVRTDDGFIRILRGQVARTAGQASQVAPTTISKDEIHALQAAAALIRVPDDVYKDLATMKREAEGQHNLQISARRYGEGIKLCQAQALLLGRQAVTSDDLTLFQHVLWNDEEDIAKAAEVTLQFAGIGAREASRLRRAFEPFKQKVMEIRDEMAQNQGPITTEQSNALTPISANLRKVLQEVEKAASDAQSAGRDASELTSLRDEVSALRTVIREEIL